MYRQQVVHSFVFALLTGAHIAFRFVQDYVKAEQEPTNQTAWVVKLEIAGEKELFGGGGVQVRFVVDYGLSVYFHLRSISDLL